MHGSMDQLFKDMFRIKMIWSSVGLFLAVALVNTQALSIQGEEAVSIHGDEVEQELDVSRVVKDGSFFYEFQQEQGSQIF